ncbi:MAG: cation diffusion facilitator family transporter [Thainema sp.]
MNEVQGQYRASYFVLLAALWITILMVMIKLWAGWSARSFVLLADALHTTIDIFSIILSLIAVTFPQRTSGRVVLGYSRAEVFGTLLLVAILGYVGISLLIGAIQRILVLLNSAQASQQLWSVDASWPLVQLVLVVAVVTICLALFERHEARVLHSEALRLNANHVLSDAWLMFASVAGLAAVAAGWNWIDPPLTIILLLTAIQSFWQVLSQQIPLFVQQTAIAPDVINQLVSQYEGITRCRCLKSQGVVGRHIYVELHVDVHPDFMSVVRNIAERIEAVIRQRYGPGCVRIGINRDRRITDPSATTVMPDFQDDDNYDDVFYNQ